MLFHLACSCSFGLVANISVWLLLVHVCVHITSCELNKNCCSRHSQSEAVFFLMALSNFSWICYYYYYYYYVCKTIYKQHTNSNSSQ